MDDNNSNTGKRTMPVCLSSKEFRLLEDYSKKKGTLNCSQALEDLAKNALNS
jgi:hypothetical protein